MMMMMHHRSVVPAQLHLSVLPISVAVEWRFRFARNVDSV